MLERRATTITKKLNPNPSRYQSQLQTPGSPCVSPSTTSLKKCHIPLLIQSTHTASPSYPHISHLSPRTDEASALTHLLTSGAPSTRLLAAGTMLARQDVRFDPLLRAAGTLVVVHLATGRSPSVSKPYTHTYSHIHIRMRMRIEVFHGGATYRQVTNRLAVAAAEDVNLGFEGILFEEIVGCEDCAVAGDANVTGGGGVRVGCAVKEGDRRHYGRCWEGSQTRRRQSVRMKRIISSRILVYNRKRRRKPTIRTGFNTPSPQYS